MLTTDDVRWLQGLAGRVYVDPAVKDYIVRVVQATRDSTGPAAEALRYVDIGASPRGSIAFLQVSRALAVLAGRNHVIPEDVHLLRHPVLRHRVHLTFEAMAERIRPEDIIDAVFDAVPVP